MAVDHMRLSQQAKDQLIKLKRNTGIEHWNVLRRWAFCLSLAEPGAPPEAKIPADSNVEMTCGCSGGATTNSFWRCSRSAACATASGPTRRSSPSSSGCTSTAASPTSPATESFGVSRT